MAVVFVTGTGTEVGKTYVTVALIAALRRRGLPVDAFKPVVSGFDPADPSGSDPVRMAEALGDPRDWARIAPRRFRAPLAPNIAARLEGRSLTLGEVTADCVARATEAAPGLLLIEGAGGVMSPLTDAATQLDLLAALAAPVVLVAGSYLGTISHTLTALACLEARGLKVAAVVISQSADGPDLAQTGAGLAAFAPGVPILLAPRALAWDAAPLADHLLG